MKVGEIIKSYRPSVVDKLVWRKWDSRSLDPSNNYREEPSAKFYFIRSY